jgi:hypothetical protein
VLDDHLPTYDVCEVHATTVAAPPEAVMEAVRAVTPREVPLLVILMALRAGPRAPRLSARRTILGGFERGGFVRLCERPDILVYGGVGRFWTPSGGLRRIEPSGFRDFAEPGYAKAAFSFELERRGDLTLLTTETRVLATDEAARRSFRRYWWLIRPGSGAIRIAWLRAIRRRAERGYAARTRRDATAATRQSAATSDNAARRLEASASDPISGGPARKPR